VEEDAASADTTVLVNLNREQFNRIQYPDDLFTTALVGSATATRDAFGSRTVAAVIATSEAEKSDGLSVSTVAIADGPILEARFVLVANGSDATVDINIGLANGTNAADADAITEHVFFHIDGGSLVINAQSKDGTTTVAAVTTTISAVVGTYQRVLDRRARSQQRQAVHRRGARAVRVDVQAQRRHRPDEGAGAHREDHRHGDREHRHRAAQRPLHGPDVSPPSHARGNARPPSGARA
jgi:hypothetical protein